MQQQIELLAKHLTHQRTEYDNILCAICGADGIGGFRLKDAISTKFNDWQYIRFSSEYICHNCHACLDSKSFNGKAMRSYSVIATEDAITPIQHSEIVVNILDPPEPPFVFLVTFTHKKHTFFNAMLNTSRNIFSIGTETGQAHIDRGHFASEYAICQKLYDAGLSKSEIETGEYRKWARIDAMGGEFWELEGSIALLRGTANFGFMMKVLQKGDDDDKN